MEAAPARTSNAADRHARVLSDREPEPLVRRLISVQVPRLRTANVATRRSCCRRTISRLTVVRLLGLRLMVGLALGAVGVLATSTGAAARDCVSHPDGSPEAIAAGTERLAGGAGGFFDRWDAAVIGRVVAIRTDERAGSPSYGDTQIDLVVAGVLGTTAAPRTITLQADDPGWLAGHPFEVGSSYFVPVAEGPAGESNWTDGCDPITKLGDAAATVAQLQPIAEVAGIALTEPGARRDGDGDDDDDRGNATGRGWFVPTITASALVAASATTWFARRRERTLVAR